MMNNTPVSKLDLNIYDFQLDNGLTVYVVPVKKRNNIYVTFTTKYGSRVNEFIPLGKKEMKKVPLGVAHFLEHKMFEQKNGIDPFDFFSERGASANANTTYDKTTYLFSGPSSFEENLNYLLNYVQEPYFTSENVEKEKGIIIEEYEMYQDNPYVRGYNTLLANAFNKDAIKYPVIGIPKTIKSITKEDLYDCYNTFYHPSNMFLVVTGNVEPNEVYRIVEENQKEKEFSRPNKIKIKTYNECDKVNKEFEEIKLNVTIPKVMIGYKINLDNFDIKDKYKKINYILLILDILFGETSIANEKMKNENIIFGAVHLDYILADNHLLVVVMAETNEKEKFINEVENTWKNSEISNEDIEIAKKNTIGSLVALSDDIFSINEKIVQGIVKYGKVLYNSYDLISGLNMNELNSIFKNIKLTNKTICLISPKNT